MTIEEEAIARMREYERATATKDFANVEPMLHRSAFYRFNDGDSAGVDAIRKAFAITWERIKDEVYFLSDMKAHALDVNTAVVTYVFHWTGTVEGQPATGEGRGFNMLTRDVQGRLKIAAEVLTN